VLRRSRVRLILKISPSSKPEWFGAFLLCQSRQKISALALQLCQKFPVWWHRKKTRFLKTIDFIEFSRRSHNWHCQSLKEIVGTKN
jgi:hypothetical protein